MAGAWRPRPAHLLGDPGLQLPADVAPGHAVQVLQLAQQQQGPALGVRVPGARLELQPHARHLPPPNSQPGCPAPSAPLRPGSAPPRPAWPRRPAFAAAAGPHSPAGPTRGARGRRRRRGAGRTAPSGPPLGTSGAGVPGTAPAPTQAPFSWFLDSMLSLLPEAAVATGLDNLACRSPFFSVGRLLSLTLARKVTVQQCEQAAPAACTWSPVLGKKS